VEMMTNARTLVLRCEIICVSSSVADLPFADSRRPCAVGPCPQDERTVRV
jgi:hypothetical protein